MPRVALPRKDRAHNPGALGGHVAGPQPLHDGDRIRIGDSEFSYLQ